MPVDKDMMQEVFKKVCKERNEFPRSDHHAFLHEFAEQVAKEHAKVDGRLDMIWKVKAGFDDWASKPHNAKWVRKIAGTPIENDVVVCIANKLNIDEGTSEPS